MCAEAVGLFRIEKVGYRESTFFFSVPTVVPGAVYTVPTSLLTWHPFGKETEAERGEVVSSRRHRVRPLHQPLRALQEAPSGGQP